MKKFFSILGFAVFVSVVSGNLAHAELEKVMIAGMTGEATLTRGDQTMPATIGMECQKDDILKTGGNCTLDITVNDIAGCRVLPSSEFAIVDSKMSQMRFKINNGNAILNLNKLPADSKFELETPTAVASVRGTQFWGRVDTAILDNPVTTFAVREGVVEILAKSIGKSFTLEKGQALDIPKDKSVVPSIRPALEEELAAMAQADAIKTAA